MSIGDHIPTLRTTTAPFTVPAGQTWVIKEAYFNSTAISVTASGTTYLFSAGCRSANESNLPDILARKFPPLKPGDSVTGTGTIYYWILETDFTTSPDPIPTVRNYNDSDTDTDSGTITPTPATNRIYTYDFVVPAGETWYLNYAEALWSASATQSSSFGYIMGLFEAWIFREGTSFKVLDTLYDPQTTSWSTSGSAQILDYTGTILRPGDKFRMTISLTIATGYTGSWTWTGSWTVLGQFNVGYWILEQDF